jgi:hypothetical protein
MAPHITAQETHQWSLKISISTPKRLLQQYRHLSDLTASAYVRFA